MAQLAIDPKLARAARAIAHATEALDGQANAMDWLNKPNPYLGNKTPLDVIFNSEPEQIEAVHELLSAVENGMYV